MKALAIFLMGIFFAINSIPTKAGNIEAEISEVKSKYCNLFVFKAGKDYLGSTVEVFHSNGDLVSSETLENRRMIIDFCDISVGNYIIRITKGNEVREFQHQRLPR